jgi:hypothetical protein
MICRLPWFKYKYSEFSQAKARLSLASLINQQSMGYFSATNGALNCREAKAQRQIQERGKCNWFLNENCGDMGQSPTYYMGKRILDDSSSVDVLIPFRSERGKSLLIDCLRSGCSDVYLSLAEQFLTQSSPPSCGVATLAMVLNSLRIDPGRVWQKPWRWFNEEMLVSCFDRDNSKDNAGLTMEHFGLIAECNGAVAQTFYASNTSLEDFRTVLRSLLSSGAPRRLVVAFDRSVLGQTGTGHYSPVGCYHEKSDTILIMDVARFKYPPYWVPVQSVWEAMRTIDPESRRSRGFFSISAAPAVDPTPISNISPISFYFNRGDLSAFFDRENVMLKRAAAQLVHDIRKRILSHPSIDNPSSTLIDCSSYLDGASILRRVRDSPEVKDLLPVEKSASCHFTQENQMRPVDFFIQSMPQLVPELITLCILETETPSFHLKFSNDSDELGNQLTRFHYS